MIDKLKRLFGVRPAKPPLTYMELLVAATDFHFDRLRPIHDDHADQKRLFRARLLANIDLCRLQLKPKASEIFERLDVLASKVVTCCYDHDKDVAALTEIQGMCRNLKLFGQDRESFAKSMTVDKLLETLEKQQ